MKMTAKYIITKDKKIIVFGTVFTHSDFSHMSPIRAGFIAFGTGKDGNPDCSCFGESLSLGMQSDPDEDTNIAKFQLSL